MDNAIGENAVDQLLKIFSESFDSEEYYSQEKSENPEDLFRSCCIVGYPKKEEAKNYLPCGSVEVEDTPYALYRLLYLLKPEKLHFGDMYKSALLGIFSADKRYLVSVEFFKYEICLYFYCVREAIEGNAEIIQAGHPDEDNGTSCKEEEGKRFFEMVELALDHEWDVYPGNSFTA